MLRNRMLLGLFLLCTPHLVHTQMDLQWLEELKSNVVKVSGTENGFGFIIGEQNNRLYLVTAAHVILGPYFDGNPPAIGAEFYNDRRIYNCTLISIFEDYDLALLEAPPPIALEWEPASADFAPAMYQHVRFIGRSEDWVISLQGQINRLGVSKLYADIIGIQPGCSGAPLINQNGIVGLITEQDGVQATAVDINTIREVINSNRYNYFNLLPASHQKKQQSSAHEDEDYQSFLAWKEAKRLHTEDSYSTYIRLFPTGEFVPMARDSLQSLQELYRPPLTEKGVDLQQPLTAPDRELQNPIHYESINDDVTENPNERFVLEHTDELTESPPGEPVNESQTESINAEAEVFVQPGNFLMGCTEEQARCDKTERLHEVYLDGFYMSRYEVTNAEFAEFLSEEGNRGQDGKPWADETAAFFQINNTSGRYEARAGYEDHPVVAVSWQGANAFCEWKTRKTGYTHRLPTEAEWEYAARGGHLATPTQYAGGKDLQEVGWFGSNADRKTHQVGQKAPNELGLYDMSGNVWEWCNDWYEGNYYIKSPAQNPKGPLDGTYRVIRGGSWYNFPWICRVGLRYNSLPNAYFDRIGFRFVRLP